MDQPGEPRDSDPRVGLCATCTHSEPVVSSRRVTFWRCGLADEDRTFPKYPPLPVLRCSGYRERALRT
jgi:hypothetical protein